VSLFVFSVAPSLAFQSRGSSPWLGALRRAALREPILGGGLSPCLFPCFSCDQSRASKPCDPSLWLGALRGSALREPILGGGLFPCLFPCFPVTKPCDPARGWGVAEVCPLRTDPWRRSVPAPLSVFSPCPSPCFLPTVPSPWSGALRGTPRRGGDGRIAALRQFFREFCNAKLHDPLKAASLERGGDFPLLIISSSPS
jgi:hypothetical protein